MTDIGEQQKQIADAMGILECPTSAEKQTFRIEGYVLSRSKRNCQVWGVYLETGEDDFDYVDSIRPGQFRSGREILDHLRRLPDDEDDDRPGRAPEVA